MFASLAFIRLVDGEAELSSGAGRCEGQALMGSSQKERKNI